LRKNTPESYFCGKDAFFWKKKCTKKTLPLPVFFSEKRPKFDYQSNFSRFSGTERDEFYTPCKPEHSSMSAIFAFVLSFCVKFSCTYFAQIIYTNNLFFYSILLW
jgi:hypothetical protein